MINNKHAACASICVIIAVLFLAGCGSLTRSATRGDLDGVKKYLSEGADINQYDKWGWTPVMWSVYYNYYNVVKYMLENGAIANARTQKAYGSIAKGSTPLLIAAYYDYPGIVLRLMKHGANPKLGNERGETAYAVAEKFNFTEIMEILEGKSTKNYTTEKDEWASAETNQIILMKDGSRIVGKIISQARSHATVKTKYSTMTIEKDKISEMKFK